MSHDDGDVKGAEQEVSDVDKKIQPQQLSRFYGCPRKVETIDRANKIRSTRCTTATQIGKESARTREYSQPWHRCWSHDFIGYSGTVVRGEERRTCSSDGMQTLPVSDLVVLVLGRKK